MGAAAGLLVKAPLWAQGRPPAPRSTPAPPDAEQDAQGEAPNDTSRNENLISLKDALNKARPGNTALALAIGAENETRSAEDIKKANPDTVFRVAEAFGLSSRAFGGLTAIGSQTYPELLTDFSTANAFADMPPTQAFTLLMASLDDRQRAALTGKAGLGLSDLTTTAQKQIFEALLPDDEVVVNRRGASEEVGKNLGNLREKASAVRFRVAQEIGIQAEMKGQEYGRTDIPALTGKDAPNFYDLSSYMAYSNKDKVNGVLIRREVPNRLKPTDLNYNAPVLQAAIPLKDLKTVKDLIARVAKRTGVELYCDPNYEKQTLTFTASNQKAASASELLRATAFCLAATYRKVGPAFVLTDDLVGVGTRRQMIQDFEEECDAERAEAVQAAEKKIKGDPAQKNLKLGGFNDPLALTPEQEKTPKGPAKVTDIMDSMMALGGVSLPFEKLTPKQQEAVQSFEAAQKKQASTLPDAERAAAFQPDLDKNLHILKKLSIQMVISGVDGVVATDFGAELMPLFRPDFKLPENLVPDDILSRYKDLPKWTEIAKAYSRRAVICEALTTAEVDAALTRIAALGFNQMWLSVFENGKARIPGTPFPLDPACDPKIDLLTYAIDAGKKQSVTVCPLVYALSWGKDAPAAQQLLTLRGENSAQSAQRQFKISGRKMSGMFAAYQEFMPKTKPVPPTPNIWVDPTQPATQTALTGLFQAIRGHAGAGDPVCRDLMPPGFTGSGGGFDGLMSPRKIAALGYTPELRLAFLKKNHCDPVDISTAQYGGFGGTTFRANTSLASYDVESGGGDLLSKWNQFRVESLKTALRPLLASLITTTGDRKSSVLIAQDSLGDALSWFDIVSDPDAPFASANLFAGVNAAVAAPDAAPDAPVKPTAPPAPPSSVFLLSKEMPYEQLFRAYKGLEGVDARSVMLKSMEELNGLRKLDGIAIEE